MPRKWCDTLHAVDVLLSNIFSSRRQDGPVKGGPIKAQIHASSQPELTSRENPGKKKEPPPVPVKTYSLKQRGIEPDEIKIRNYENSNRCFHHFMLYFIFNFFRCRYISNLLMNTKPLKEKFTYIIYCFQRRLKRKKK